ncbi:hypothetical protein ACJIZ3_022488 [Penstemon smallii]|uniref:Pentatricopeptide repeat-containing protein n=1 Tax=Penstemon smallii TaxID=265156 RepID=A0ABD3TMB4_9LAMI
MIKHRVSLCKYFRRRLFATCPLTLEPQTPQFSSSPTPITHKEFCFSLAEQLINRGSLSSAQKVIQRLISQCSSIPEAISAVDFAFAKGMDLDLVSYGCLIRKLVISGEAPMAKAVYLDCVVGKGLEPDQKLLNSMIICYCKIGELDEAKSCFDRLFKLNFMPWIGSCNAIIKAFFAQDRVLESYKCFCEISDVSDVVLDFSCYNKLVDKLCHKGFLDEGLRVFDVMIDKGVPPTLHLCKSVVIGFCKWGHVEEAEILCTEIESYGFVMDKYMFTYLINAYCKGRKMKMAMRLFIRMLKMGYDPDNYTYNTLIHGFVNLGMFSKGWFLHNKMSKPNSVTYQIMLNKYCTQKKVDCALKLLDDMIQSNMAPNIHCYTSLIAALCKEQRWEEVNSLYHKMIDNGVVPDHVLFFILVKNLPGGDELYLALTFLQTIAYKSCHIDVSCTSCSTKPKSKEDAMVEIEYLLEEIAKRNSLFAESAFSVYVIALCVGGKIDPALNCMERMAILGFLPKLTALNSLIKLLFEEGLVEDGNALLEVMQDHGLVPNQTTFSIIVNELCKQGDFLLAIEVLENVEERGIKGSVAMYNSIIGCLSRQKMVKEAEFFFYRMLKFGVDPDEILFVTMINAYSKNGWARKALKLFNKMVESGLRPSSYAYTALIPGLVKKNMTEKSCVYLDRMLKEGFLPNIVLYTSLIKQFLKKRKFEFALRLVDLMERSDMEQDLITYITLVSGICRNIEPLNGKWFLSNEKSEEMLFDLLHQTTIFPNGESLKLLINSQEDMKYYALRLIQKIKKVNFMPDLYLYNGIISGFCLTHKMQEAYEHLALMESEGIHPNVVTFTILINGHLRLGEVDIAISLFNKMNANGLSADGILFNALVKHLCEMGRVHDALAISHSMQKRGFIPSKGSYEILLSSFCGYRSSVLALKIYEDMLSHDYFPCKYNLYWLVGILSKDNKLNEARTLCALMIERRNFQKDRIRY